MITDIETFQETLAASGLPPLRSGRHDGGTFRAGVTACALGPLRLIELVTPGGECFRDARGARPEDADLWQIDLMTRGRARVEQGRAAADLAPADLVLTDPARPVRFASTASTHVTLLVPRSELRLRAGDADRLVGTRIEGSRGPGALLSSLARNVTALTGFRAGDGTRAAAALTELIALALETRLGDAPPAPDEALRDRITGYVEARLSDRDLTPAAIAAAHHISVRRLHRLFEDQPFTVAALIRRRRLERCRTELARGGRTVASVAARWGFADPAHFSRLFKATYGYNATALTSSNRARTVKAPVAGRTEDEGRNGKER